MFPRHLRIAAGSCLAVLLCACPPSSPRADPVPDAGAAPVGPRLLAVGPRLISNQTSQPISVWGERLTEGLTLELSGAATLSLPLTVLDPGHAFARLPAHLESADGLAEGVLLAKLKGSDAPAQTITLINDTHFPDLTALAGSADGGWLFAASAPDDHVYAFDAQARQVTRLQTGDGPSAIAIWKSWLVVAHRFAPVLMLLPIGGGNPKILPGPANASALLVKGDHLYVAEQARDTVALLDLADNAKEKWRTPVGANPDQLALAGKALAVGCAQTGEVEWLDPETGTPMGQTAPGPNAKIVGGRTAAFTQYVMNGSAARALTFSPRLGRLFAATIGPNIGPNPEKMEVSMNGGVSVFAPPPAAAFVRHLGFGAGVTQALALDDTRGLLYAADVSLGLVRILDAKKLVGAHDAAAAKALIQEVAMVVPSDFPRIRPEADFGVNDRAGLSLHTGPQALTLSPDGKTLWVLNRFTGRLARLDVANAAKGKAAWKDEAVLLPQVLEQQNRRLGEVLYFADLGRTAMSCDACHAEGHTGGILFEKTRPLRVYRSPTVRGSRVTPPYFTPASTHSMGETSKVVGSRNRFHNPDLTPSEIENLTIYASLIPTLPNPFAGPDGAPPETLDLPDGKKGNPRNGLALFEGKAACAGCHPGPHFTTDQDLATRNKFLDVGTPHHLPLRLKMQDPHFSGFAPPALIGSWDVFPMLTTGLAGLEVKDDGSVAVAERFALRRAVEGWPKTHGRVDLLTDPEKNDLLAYVLSL